MKIRTGWTMWISVVTLWITACTAPTPPAGSPTAPDLSNDVQNVTLYVAGMNKELKIL